MEVKIVLQIENENHLFTMNLAVPLSVNINNICQNYKLNNKNYGLKLLENNGGEKINHYVNEDNFQSLNNGYKLLLTESITEKVISIFKNLNNKKDSLYRTESIKEIVNLADDPAFIKELFSQEKHTVLLELMTDANTRGYDMYSFLKVLLQILLKKSIIDINNVLIKKIIKIVEDNEPTQELIAALAVLCQVLMMRSKKYDKAKRQILETLTIEKIFKCIVIKPDLNLTLNVNNLQLNAITLINKMAKLLKGDLQMEFIKMMNDSKFKGLIYTHCIENQNVDKQMAQALNLYQTLALSILTEKKVTYINREQTNYEEVSSFRQSIISIDEAQETTDMYAQMDRDSGKFSMPDSRMSLASIASSESDGTILSIPLEYATNKISILTNECIDYYERNHNKNYLQAVAEDKHFEINFLHTAERMTKTLTKLFRIGHPPKICEFFYPIFFKISLNKCFFQELYCRAFWLISKTKREMKVSTKHDYTALFTVFESQLEVVLKSKPHDYKQLMDEMKKTTYNCISVRIQKEKELEFLKRIMDNPTTMDIQKEIKQQNEALIFEQRMTVLQKGDFFPKLGHKKTVKLFIKLNAWHTIFTWGDWDSVNKSIVDPKTFGVNDIKYLIVGEACPHVQNNIVKRQDQDLAFSVRLRDDAAINFLANNRETAHYWTDAIYMLTKSTIRSKTYEKELAALERMDLHLRLIELQNIPIPFKAPIVPPDPPSIPEM